MPEFRRKEEFHTQIARHCPNLIPAMSLRIWPGTLATGDQFPVRRRGTNNPVT